MFAHKGADQIVGGVLQHLLGGGHLDDFSGGHEAVSYTHLDVYKRQVTLPPAGTVTGKDRYSTRSWDRASIRISSSRTSLYLSLIHI